MKKIHQRPKHRSEARTRLFAACIGGLLAMFVGRACLQKVGAPLVSLSYDMPFLMQRAANADSIRIVYLDEIKNDILAREPQAALLKAIGAAGAKAVIYDVAFVKPSDDPAIDLAFASAMREFRGVDQKGNPLPGAQRRHVFLASLRENSEHAGYAEEKIYRPTPLLRKAADGNGIVACEHENYYIRKLSTGTEEYPSLTWLAATKFGIALQEEQRLQPRWLNYIGPPPDRGDATSLAPFPSCDAKNVIAGSLGPLFLRDKIVIIGAKPEVAGAALGKDLFLSPFHRVRAGRKFPPISGVEVQANFLSNLMLGNWLTRSHEIYDLPLTILAGLLFGVGLTFLRPLLAVATAGLSIIAFAAAGLCSIHYGNIWFPWTIVAFAQVPIALVWGIASHSYIERFFKLKISAEQAVTREAFAKYLSPKMLDQLTEENFQTDLGGKQLKAAMMFTDLESFTDMCEEIREPHRIVEILNGYFENTTGSIFKYHGIIIKFIGDAIFAAWGAPKPDPHAALHAVRAAWELHRNAILLVNDRRLRTRIGIHFGDVVAGNVGTSKHIDYTLVGDAVNLAARLEGLNKHFATSILLSDEVFVHLNDEFRTRIVGKFRVKGRKEAVVVHELLGLATDEPYPQWLTLYQQAQQALYQNDTAHALELFSATILSRSPHGDGPSTFFIERLHSQGSLLDGIVELYEK